MKRSNLYKGYVAALFCSTLIFLIGCTKEKGYYETPNVIVGTDLNTYDYLKSKPGVYDSLLLVIDELGMQNVLRDSSVTMFAVSNQGFQIALKNLNNTRKAKGQRSIFLKELASGFSSIPSQKVKATGDSANLDTMVSRYIVRGLFKTSDFSVGDGLNIFSVRGGYPMHARRLYADAEGMQGGGSEIIEFANTKRSVFVPNWELATTSSVNIKTKNGIVHLLEPDHVFGYDEFARRLTYIPPPPNLFLMPGSTWFMQFQDPNAVDGSVDPGEKFIKVHDGNVLTKFIAVFNPNSNRITMNWVAPEPVISNVYTLATANDSAPRDPRSWVVEGSLDGVNYVRLDSRQDVVWQSRFQMKVFDFENTVPYKYYRVIILTNWGDGSLMQLSEWTMNYRAPVN